jgi:hypothetical protein
MAGFTQRLAGWTAGRLGGSKARKSTMDWMEKTGLGKALSFAGDTAITGAAFKGIGGLKNLIAPGVPDAVTQTINVPGLPEGTGLTQAASVPEAAAGAAGGGLKPLPQMPGRPSVGRLYPGAPTLRGNQAESYLNALRAPGAPSAAGAAPMSSLGELFGTGVRTATRLARENPEITAGLLQGGIEAYGGAAEREMMRQEMLRRRQQQENLAALLMPMYAQYYGIGG